MRLSRRAFVHALGIGTAGALSGTLIASRGREALVGLGSEIGDAVGSDWMVGLEAANVIRISSNENPNGPGERALEAIRAAFGEASRYPSQFASSVTSAIAKHLGIEEEQLLLGCGSGEVLRVSVMAFTSASRPLVVGSPTFEEPERTAEAFGTPVRRVPVDANLKLDLNGMATQARGAGLVFLCNPNNPTATVHPAGQVADFVRRVRRDSPDTVVLVDEAYHEYVDDPEYKTSIPLALQDTGVIVSRTFSKIYGMAGLRLGYAVAQADTIARLRRYRLPINVNVLAAAAGAVTLEDTARVEREQGLNRDAREYTRKALAEMGYPSVPSHTNFIMVPIRRDARAFETACREHGVLVGRVFPPLVDHARISIGTMDEMRAATDVFRRVLGASTPSRG